MMAPPLDRGQDTREQGFTLIEALLAITLLSLLSLLVLGALRFGINGWQRGQEISADMDEAIHAQGFLRRSIANASPHFVSLPGGRGYVDFEGRASSLTFISDPPVSHNRSGRLRMTIRLAQRHGRSALILAIRPELAQGSGQEAQATERVLIEDIETAKFSYYGSKAPSGPEGWHSDWVREAALPALVRIELTSREGFEWPPLLIRPRIDVDVSCVYDALTRRCRGR